VFFNQAGLVYLFLFYAALSLSFAGLDNELFYMDKTMMVFGDAKKVIEDMVKAVE
jgi:NAD(P) transhydrogenase subunit beta